MRCKLKATLLFLCCLAALQTAHFVASQNCADSLFDCKNGKCIAHFFQCDEDNDCGNFEDEMNCFTPPEPAGSNGSSIFSVDIWHKDEKACPTDHFACNDTFHTCLPKRWVCDGMSECSNGADEKNCTAANVTCNDDFMCANLQCVPSFWRCDGIFDCDDNSDELNCTSFKKTDFCDKEHGMYQCTTGECISYSKVCDKHNDCLLADDEGVQCHLNACHDKKCSHLCMYNQVTNASVCYCPPGFRLTNETCHDFNECDDNKLTNVCSQKCTNLEGSYKCDCFEDYQMVNGTCQAKGPSPVLYFSTGREIRAYDLRNQTYYSVVESKNRAEIIVGMDMLVEKQKLIFFGSTEHSHGFVYEVSMEGNEELKNSHMELLYHEDLKGIEGLAVDWLAGHFYITESALNRIIVCNLDSVICGTLMSKLSQPRGILTQPTKGKLFWTQWGANAGIFQAAMDGTGASMLLDKVQWPNDLAMDEEMNRLYWCDGKDGLIEFYDFDTQVRHMVFRDHNRQPYSLSVFEDNLYWSDWATNQIEVCNKISGHHMKPLIMNAQDRFFGLAVYHPLMHKTSARLTPFNPCEQSLCSHLCLLKAGAIEYACRCPDHMILTADNQTCVSRTDEPFLLLSTGYKVLKYYLNSISSSYSEELKFLPLYSIAEIAFNFERDELYIHDTFKNRIGALDLKKKRHLQWRTLVPDGLNGVMSMLFDVNTDSLYWVDMIKGTLEVASTQGRGRATLNDQLPKPISLAICAPARKMYIGLRSTPAEIVSLNMDGTSKQTLTKSSNGLPLALALEGRNQLLWGDPVLQKIEFLNIGDNKRPIEQPHKLISTHVDTINSIGVANETVYWTNIDSAAFYYSSMEPSASGLKQRVVHRRRLTEHDVNLDLLKVLVAAKQTPVYEYCLTGKHHCAHLCLISAAATGPTCKCSDGYISADGGLTCTKVAKPTKPGAVFTKIFDADEFFGMITGNWKDSDQEDTWVVQVNTDDHSAQQKQSSSTVRPTPAAASNADRSKTDNALHPNTTADANVSQAQRSSSSGFWKTIGKVAFFLFIIIVAIFAFFWWKDLTFREQVMDRVDKVRNRKDKQVRFVKNQLYEPECVTSVDEPAKKAEPSGDNNNPFK